VIVLSFTLAVVAILRGNGEKVEEAFAGTLVGYLARELQSVISYYYRQLGRQRSSD